MPRKSRSKENKRGDDNEIAVIPPRPGDVLRVYLFDGRELTQDRFADVIGVSRYSINQLVNNRRAITPEMALRLGRATDTSPEFWLNLQRNADLFEARRRLAKDLANIQPLSELIKEGH